MRNRGLTIALTIVASAIMFATMPQFVRAQVTYIEFSKLQPTQASYDINAPMPASNLLKQYSFGISSSMKADVRLATTRLEEMFAQHSYNTVHLSKLISQKSFDYFAESLNSKHKLTMKLIRIQERFASKQLNKTANALATAGINAKENSREVFEQINVNAYEFVDGSVKGIQKSPTVMVRVANNSANYALDRLTDIVDSQTQQIAKALDNARALKNDTVLASSGAMLVRANLSDHPVVADIIPKLEIDSSKLAIADLFKSEVDKTFDFTDYRSFNQIEQSTSLKTYITQNLLATPATLLAIYESKIYTRPSIPQVDPAEIYAALPEIYLGTSAQGLMDSKIHESPKFAFTFPGENINLATFNERTDLVLATSTNILKKFVLNDFSDVYYRVANVFNTSEQTQQLVDLKLERVGQLADLLIVPTKRTLNLAINTSVPVQFSSNGSFLFDKVFTPQQVVYRNVTPRVLGDSTTSWWDSLVSMFVGTSQTTTVIYQPVSEPVVSPVQTVQPVQTSSGSSLGNLTTTITNIVRNILNSGEYTLLQGPKGDTGAVGPQGPKGAGSVTNITLPDQYDQLSISTLTVPSLTTPGILKNDASGVVSSLVYGNNGECLTIASGAPDWGVCGGGGGADADATYIVQTATDAPTNAQVLASLATGLLKNTTTTGVLSVATAGTDYVVPSVASLSSLATIGTITSGTWQGTAVADTYVANDLTISGGTINNSAIGGVTPSTGAFTTGSFSGAFAANGGITFDNSTDTLGAFTSAGTIDLNTNILTNIGNAGTDFVAGTGALTLAGDLTISGDDLFMGTNTSGFILVADGTNYNPVAMSGDITIDSTGATSIGDDKVTEADLKAVDSSVDEECLTYESTTGDFEWQTCGGGITIGNAITSGSVNTVLYSDSSGNLAQTSTGGGGTLCLVSTNGGAPTFGACSGSAATAWSSLTAPSGNLSVAHAANTTTMTFNSVTSGTAWTQSSSSLTTGKLLDLQVSGTAAAASQTALNILTAGANASSAITTYGAQISNTHTNATSGTNVALYLNASGATTANYGLIVNAGNVGLGITNPSAKLSLGTDITTAKLLMFDSGNTKYGMGMANYTLRIFSASDGNISFGKLSTADGSTYTDIMTVLNTGNVSITGDLTVTGDDLFMTTNTSGHMLIADGTNYNPVAMSGDITITSGGVTSIGADKVTEADLKVVDSAVDEECFTYESTTGDFEWQTCSQWTTNGTSIYYSTGNVGLGIASPGAKLSLGTDITTSKLLMYDSGNTKYGMGLAAATLRIFSASDGNISFGKLSTADGTTYTDIMTILNGGNVGIGDTSPDATLNVLSTTEQLRLDYSDSFYTSFTTSSAGDLTIAPNGGDLAVTGALASSGVLQGGSATATTYSRLGTGTAGNLDAANDLLVSDELEVDGVAYFDGTVSLNTVATSGRGLYATSSTLTSGWLVDLQVSGTAAATNQTALNILTAGANATSGQTTYGAQISNTHTNVTSGTNVALYLNASGATTANYGLIVNSGYVGIGTTAPGAKLSLGTDITTSKLLMFDSGNTKYGFGLAAATLRLFSANNGNISFGTVSTTDGSTYADLMTILNTGKVGIGITNPSYPLHVVLGAAGVVARFTDSDGSCDIDPTSTALVCSSDQRLKRDVETIETALEKVLQFRGVNFKWNTQTDDALRIGFLAQEVESVVPELVKTDSKTGYKSVNYTGFAPILVNAIKEQQDQIDLLTESLSLLQGNISGNLPSATEIKNRLYLSVDSVGQARILSGNKTVRVSFSEPYQYQPIVTVSARGEEALDNNFRYAVVEEDELGFTIKISSSQNEAIEFSWHAFASESAKLTVSDGSTTNIILVKIDQGADVVAEETDADQTGQVAGDSTTEPVIVEEVLPIEEFFVGEPDAQTDPVTEPTAEIIPEPVVETSQEESLPEESSPQ